MPLLKKTLETNIKAALKIGSASGSEEEVARSLADAIHTYVSAADVSTTVTTTTTGTFVGTGSGPTTGTGAGTGKGSLS
jgi:hypothetical protein